MRTPLVFSVLGATLMTAGVLTAHAAGGVYYEPSNPASTTGKTVGHELFGTIGCPGRGLLDSPCPKPPQDSDGDGVVDSKDKCPATPAGRKVNADGCELDSDKDGVVDGVDKCPTVFAKTADGCPEGAPQKLVLEGVNFDNNNATLTPESFATLDQAAATLKEWGDVRVEVAGHSDSVGKDSYNLALSQRRAESVRQYLIKKGVPADRLLARGYGETRPVADNATEEGRLKNRRVELVAIQ
jgi:outer membrane protein OmpA-like peptidoglycan-associated protein